MPTSIELWDSYCDRAHAAAHPATEGRDLLDVCADLGELEVEVHHLGELFAYAADPECGALRRPVLRAHAADLRHMQSIINALVSEAEVA